jgi:hypothetical protein
MNTRRSTAVRHARIAGVIAGLILAASACGQSAPADTTNKSEPDAPSVVTVTERLASTTTPEPVTAPIESSDSDQVTADVAGSFPMPNEVGKVLQDAQDHLQQVSGDPLYFSDSTDATGAGRMQVVDRNWKVCSQNVAPGEMVGDDTTVVFAAVKTGEDCP